MLYVVFVLLLKLTKANENENFVLIEKAVLIASQYYKHQFVTSVVWSDKESGEVDAFLKKFRGSVVTISLHDINNTEIHNVKQIFKYKQIVFFATDSELFQYFSNLLMKRIKFPIRLILVLKKSVTERLEISTFLEIAWKNNLVDVVIISKNKSDQITTSTYYPHSNGNCDNISSVTLETGEFIFPNKFKNFNKCPIRLSVLNIPRLLHLKIENGTIIGIEGSDGHILMIIVNKLNASFTFKENIAYGSYTNRTATHGLADLKFKRTDILVPGAVLNGRYFITQTSHIYYSADMRWIGPKRRQIYQGLKLLIPFFNNVTPCLFFTYLLFVTVLLVIRRRREMYQLNKKVSLCFQAFTLLLGQSVNYVTKVPLLNKLFLLWIWFCFIIRLAYQGYLVDILQSRILEPPFESLEDALKLVKGYGGSEGMLEFYKGTPVESKYHIMKTADEFIAYLDRIVEGDRLLAILDYITRERYRHTIQVLNTPISSTMVCLYMRRDWPAANTVDSILVRLLETGIVKKILSSGSRIFTEQSDKVKYAQPLSLLMLSSCFYMMGFMWFVCSVIFLIEILYHKHYHLD